MDNKQFKLKIKELQANLENEKVIQELTKQQFDLDDLNKKLEIFYNNIEQISDEHLFNEITKKINEQIEYTNERSFPSYSHRFINNGKFLISNIPTEINTNTEEDNSIEEVKISEDEFIERYNKLIELLNFEGEESNLVLETKSQGKPFKVYKTNVNSIAIYAESSKKPMTIATQKFIDVAFKRDTSNLVYVVDVLIPKIKDNSIFDFIQNDPIRKDLMEAIKDRQTKNEDELIVVKNELEKIQVENKTLDEKAQLFNSIIDKF